MTGQKAHHVPQPTPRFAIDAGGYYGTRNLNYEADGETAAVQREGQGPAARRRGLSVSAAEARRRSPASASSSRCSIRSPAPSAATPRTRSATTSSTTTAGICRRLASAARRRHAERPRRLRPGGVRAVDRLPARGSELPVQVPLRGRRRRPQHHGARVARLRREVLLRDGDWRPGRRHELVRPRRDRRLRPRRPLLDPAALEAVRARRARVPPLRDGARRRRAHHRTGDGAVRCRQHVQREAEPRRHVLRPIRRDPRRARGRPCAGRCQFRRTSTVSTAERDLGPTSRS